MEADGTVKGVFGGGEFTSRTALAARIDDFVLACGEHDAKPDRWTHDGTPLKAA